MAAKRFRTIWRWTVLVCAVIVAVCLALSSHYRLGIGDFLKQSARVVATPVYAFVYREDVREAREIVSTYYHGDVRLRGHSARMSWQKLEREVPGVELIAGGGELQAERESPFVYERDDAAYLRRLRDRFHLESVVANATDEYDAMLKLGGWLGTRWDHGADRLAGDSRVCDPVAIIEAGEQGAKYWCEIAARTTVYAATALGWQARVITGSRDGYTWEHAVAELWSNQFDKWFAMDTDFNVVYEHDGVPLSALELSRDGERLARNGELHPRMIARSKASLPLTDLLPLYAYVHVDLRTDWCSRTLRRGSPAAGDLATWWTARPSLGPVLTAKQRMDAEAEFDWKVNDVAIHLVKGGQGSGGLELELGLIAYAPNFAAFEMSVDEEDWRLVEPPVLLSVTEGKHLIRARVRTGAAAPGPATSVELRYAPAAARAVSAAPTQH